MSKNNSRRSARWSKVGKRGLELGELGETAFLHKATSLGFHVSKPFGNSEQYDFIVASGDRLWRVQVKTTSFMCRDLYKVCCVRHFPPGRIRHSEHYRPSQVDVFAAYIAPEDTWYVIPVEVVCSRRCIYLFSKARCERKPSRRRGGWPGGQFERYREAWHLIREKG